MRDAALHEHECVACPSAGSCGGQFPANTMACVSEAVGLALPGSAGGPAPHGTRDQYTQASGEAAVKLLRLSHPARQIWLRENSANPAAGVAGARGAANT